MRFLNSSAIFSFSFIFLSQVFRIQEKLLSAFNSSSFSMMM